MKKLLLVVVLVFSSFVMKAQNKSFWQIIEEQTIESQPKVKRASFPTDYKVWKLDVQNLKNHLRNAPIRGEFQGVSNVIIQLPDANGLLQSFRVLETPIMEAGLAAQFPNIKSYVGIGIDDKTAVARFSVTEFGLHSMTLSAGKSTAFIDPYTENTQNYIVYNRASLVGNGQTFECLTDEGVHLPSLENDRRANATFRADTDDKKLRTYRLAQSCTAEYGNIFRGNTADPIATQKGRIQAQMAITMTRVNGVYENDLAITMIFVANNSAVIYLGTVTADPWSNEWNTKTAQTIDANIGFANYDIGHNFNTTGGGNAGCIGCVCSTITATNGNHKGRGYTGRTDPTGDAFDIDYVAHEMGHQFGGYHTQSSSGCRSGSGATEVEPGSGSTIMAYAGICASNVQSNSDAYFAYVNIRDIMENVKTGISSACPQITTFSNNPPTANAGRDYIIPKSTAFMLVGQGSDPEGDPITYTWEENDPEDPATTAAPVATRAAGPMFRSIWGTASTTRYMPSMATVLTGATSNTWEVCPSVARDLNFSLTVRDNNSGIGQTATDLMKVTVNGTAGPFVINIPNTAVSWAAGTNQTVTWNVAGTDVNGINAKFVDIYLSTNGGTSFPTLLASKVPNDGSETITVPNTVGTTNRIMVKGWDNIFFDVSNTNFSITAPANTMAIAFNGTQGEQNKSVCQGGSISYPISYSTLGTFSGTTTFSATGNPAGTSVTFSPVSITATGTVTMTISNTTGITPGFYTVIVTATSGAITKTAPFYLDLLSGNFGTQTLSTPADLATAVTTATNLTWPSNASATMYDVQVATDNAFTNIIATATVTTNSYALSGLLEATNYFWRVKPKNTGCEGVYSSFYKFTTGASNCTFVYSNNTTLNIPDGTGSGVYGTEVSKTIVVPGTVTGNLNSLTVDLNFTHAYVDDAQIWLTHPDGTAVYLWNHNCENEFSSVTLTFQDGAGTIPLDASCTATNANGTFAPNTPLSALAGKPAAGTWVLRARDYWTGDTGSITTWRINLCVSQPALSSESFGIDDFVLYPNPNNGNFNVQFTSTSGNEIKVNVHDVRGREIFNKSYTNTGLFNESLQLNNVQAGIYLVTVQDGARKEVKKIVIQ